MLDYADIKEYVLPSDAQQVIQNQLVLDLKTDGIWNKLDVFYVNANNGSREFGTLNWIDPVNHQMTEHNSPTWTSDVGYKGNNSTAYTNMNWNPTDDGSNFIQNSASMFMYVANDHDADTGYSNYMGSYTTGSDRIMLYESNTLVGYFNNNGQYEEGVNGADGFLHTNRSTSTLSRLYKNGLQIDTDATASSGISASDVWVGVTNNNGSIAQPSNVEWSIVGLGGDLSSEAVDLDNSIGKYIADLTIPYDNLIAYYNLDSDATDNHGTHDGTTNSVTYATGKMGDAQHTADVVSAGATIPSSTDFTFGNGITDEPFSVSMYVNFDAMATSTDAGLIARRQSTTSNLEWQIFIVNETLFFALFSELGDTNNIHLSYSLTGISTGTWYNMMFTYDGSGTKEGLSMYLDNGASIGTLVEEGTYVAMDESTAPMTIGFMGYSTIFSLDGLLDGVAIWNKELTAEERESIFNKQSGGHELVD